MTRQDHSKRTLSRRVAVSMNGNDRVALPVRAGTGLDADDRDAAVPLQLGERAIHLAEPHRAGGAEPAVVGTV
jgi:hypothetical protein